MRWRVGESAVTEGHPQIQMLSPEASEEAAVPAAAATVPAANRRRVVATGNRASAERAARSRGRKVAKGSGYGAPGARPWPPTGRSLPASPPPPQALRTPGLQLGSASSRRPPRSAAALPCLRAGVKILAPSGKATWQPGLEARRPLKGSGSRARPSARPGWPRLQWVAARARALPGPGWRASRPLFSTRWPTLAGGGWGGACMETPRRRHGGGVRGIGCCT